ncbi:MAG TPA: NUDIX domain-containing protein, partial [Anaeromyxobacteraceae bacterium]|nr:NUDIX domain-containing protein [Anaeromyxobacteraceae bacterium]
YRVWLAEVMLQQTQVAAAVPYYRRFVERFPSLIALAAATEEEVLLLWSGLGYYARGRRLHAAARAALARHGGLPADLAALRALPGFGPYTAGAVASIAFAIPEACVDGNVSRVLARLALLEGAPESRAVRDGLWKLARELVDPARPGDWNQALMELGATVCVKPAPRCVRCPLESLCLARAIGRERELPPARVRRAPVLLHLACAAVERGGALLVARRPVGGLFAGMWELPSVEVVGGAEPRRALRAGLASRGLPITVGREVVRVERTLTHRRLSLGAHRCTVRGEGPVPERQDLRFAAPAELAALPVPAAFRRLLAALALAPSGRSGAHPAGARNLAVGNGDDFD